jgi:hypothetical protein
LFYFCFETTRPKGWRFTLAEVLYGWKTARSLPVVDLQTLLKNRHGPPSDLFMVFPIFYWPVHQICKPVSSALVEQPKMFLKFLEL